MLKYSSKGSILEFDWDAFKTELSTDAPVLVYLLEACTHSKTP